MPTYRLYPIKDGHVFEPPKIIESPKDEDAIEKTRQLVDGHPIEVWERDRFIVEIKPEK